MNNIIVHIINWLLKLSVLKLFNDPLISIISLFSLLGQSIFMFFQCNIRPELNYYF